MDINDIDEYDRIYTRSNESVSTARDLLNRELATEDHSRPVTDATCREGISSDIRKLEGSWEALYTGELDDSDIAETVKQVLTDADWTYRLGDNEETLVFTLDGPSGTTLTGYYHPTTIEAEAEGGRWLEMRIESNCLDISGDVREHIRDNDL